MYRTFLPAYKSAKIIFKKSIKIFQSYDHKCTATFLWFIVYCQNIYDNGCAYITWMSALTVQSSLIWLPIVRVTE